MIHGSSRHISLASFSGMLERTIITSSLSKTFSVTGPFLYRSNETSSTLGFDVVITQKHITFQNFGGSCRNLLYKKPYPGWRIGWAMAPKGISTAISNIHVKLTDSAPAPFQVAAVVALSNCGTYYSELRKVLVFATLTFTIVCPRRNPSISIIICIYHIDIV